MITIEAKESHSPPQHATIGPRRRNRSGNPHTTVRRTILLVFATVVAKIAVAIVIALLVLMISGAHCAYGDTHDIIYVFGLGRKEMTETRFKKIAIISPFR